MRIVSNPLNIQILQLQIFPLKPHIITTFLQLIIESTQLNIQLYSTLPSNSDKWQVIIPRTSAYALNAQKHFLIFDIGLHEILFKIFSLFRHIFGIYA